jgi:amino acid permease
VCLFVCLCVWCVCYFYKKISSRISLNEDIKSINQQQQQQQQEQEQKEQQEQKKKGMSP